MKYLVLVGTLALIGCGGSTTEPLSVATSAAIVLSGAQTGSFTSGTPISTFYANASQSGGYTFTTASGITPVISVAIAFSGEPAVRHYKNTDAGAAAGLAVTQSVSAAWLASIGGGSAAVGSYDLNLTSVSTITTVSNGKTYKVSGTLDAVLPAAAGTGTTGTVTMHVTF